MTLHNAIPLPSWHDTAEAWARNITAPEAYRRAAIAELAKAGSPALAAISDPVGIRMVSDARIALWSNADSETMPRPDMAQIDGGAADFVREAETVVSQVMAFLIGAAVGIGIGALVWAAFGNAAARAQADLDRAAAVGAW